jgi:CHASE3 domain sensor protein
MVRDLDCPLSCKTSLPWLGRLVQGQINPALGFPLSLVVILLGTIVSIWNITRVYQSLIWVTRTHEALMRLQRFHAALRDVEASFRGFAIAGEPRFLAPYQTDVAQVYDNLTRLRQLTSDNLAKVKTIAKYWLEIVELPDKANGE